MRTPADPKPTDSSVQIRDFPGMSTASDPHDLAVGKSVSQVNVFPVRPGELRVRPGYRVVKFEG